MLETIFYNLCELMIATSFIIIIVLWIVPFADKYYGVKWRKTLWILLAIRLLIPYNFSFTNTLIKLPQINFELGSGVWAMSLTIVLILSWLTGAFVYLKMQQLNFEHFRNEIINTVEKVDNQESLELFIKTKKEMNIKKHIRLYQCNKIKTPMVIGILQPVMLLPYKAYSMDDLSNIFHHEFMHIKNHDGWYKIFMLIITSLYWFNPFVHMMTKSSYNDIELVCDKDVTQNMNQSQRARYSETILSAIIPQTKRDLAITTCFYGSKRMMKKRIENVFDESKKKPGYFMMVLIIVLFMGFDLLISFNDTMAKNNNEADIPQTISEESSAVTSETETKYFSDGGVHPYNNTLKADTELCKEARDKLLGVLSDSDKDFVCTQIRKAHWWIEFRLVYAHSWAKDSIDWNNINYVIDKYTYNGKTIILPHLDYTGVESIEYLKKVKEIVNDNYFTFDIDRAIKAMQEAIDTHDMQNLYEFHQILHDLDYWLTNYPVGTFKTAPADWHGIYVYFGVLKSYQCVE